MRIKDDEQTIILPLDLNTKNILIKNDLADKAILYMRNYFRLKKKNVCCIYDDEDQAINFKEVEFIYIPYGKLIDNNFHFKEKTDFNYFISEIMKENPEYFQTMEDVREKLLDLVTDKGFIKVQKIMSSGLKNLVEVKLTDFNYNSILPMYEVVGDLSDDERYLVAYNLLIHTFRNIQSLVIFLDIPFTEKVDRWIDYLPKNTYVIVCSESISGYYPENAAVIKLGNTTTIQSENINNELFKKIIYLNHPIIKQNMELQTKENIKISQLFNDDSLNYFFKTVTYNISKTL